ncbi:uncharacterized protein LOC111043305 isoform X4 [Nilaparvata lugens]|uniref:uncharacterized protein LOC111043305 isoform X4 n=1 Tax=Nilaparvata lugens TaxID=108931 RepID=UPI00193D39EB|nr:uncharacterized protein LOC111043305 isoform X4 [Nilaparvata lugens]
MSCGGTAVYVEEKLKSEVRIVDLKRFSVDSVIELYAVLYLSCSLLILTVYRSSNGDINSFFDMLEDCLGHLNALQYQIVMCGDFNIHLEEYGVLENRFTVLLRSYGLIIGNRAPTRGTACLDTVATMLDSWDYVVEVIEPVVADHQALLIDVGLSKAERVNPEWFCKYRFTHRRTDENNLPVFAGMLGRVNWSIYINCDWRISFSNFFQRFMSMFDDFLPKRVRRFTGRRNEPFSHVDKSWYTADLASIRTLVIIANNMYKNVVTAEERNKFYSAYLRLKKIYQPDIVNSKSIWNEGRIRNAPNPC